MKNALQWSVSIGLFALFGWKLVNQLQEHSEALSQIQADALRLWPAYLAVFAFFFMAMVIRAHRWSLTLGRTSYFWLSFRSIAIGYLVQCPLSKLGEIARMANQKKFSSLGMGQIVSTVFVDRLLDILCLCAVLITTTHLSQGLLEENFPELSGQLPKLMILMSLGLAGLISVIVFQNKILDILQKWSFIPHTLKSAFANFVKQFNIGIFHCRQTKMIIYLILSNLVIWVLYFLCFVGTLAYFPQMPSSITMSDYFVIFTIASLGVLMPVPGGMAYPLFTQKALIMVCPDLDESIALSISLVLYIVNYWAVNLLWGGMAWIFQMLQKPSTIAAQTS